MHFNKLNYSFVNETTEIELDRMNQFEDDVLCVAGSGARVIPLLSKEPRNIDVIDTSLPQLWMTELRYRALQKLTREEYLILFGYLKAQPSVRIEVFNKIPLISEQKKFWITTKEEWLDKGFNYIGRWEKKIQLLRKIFYLYHFKSLDKIFLENNKTLFPRNSWKYFCKTVLNHKLVNKLLYSGGSVYNRDQSFSDFINESVLERIEKHDLREEFFLQLLFSGKLLSEKAWPIEVNSDTFSKSQSSRTQVRFIHSDLGVLKNMKYSFYSLSDCFSYMDPESVQKFLGNIALSGRPCHGVFREFMRTHKLDKQNSLELYEVQGSLEKVPVYRIKYFKL